MSIQIASIYLHSAERSCAQLSALMGAAPKRAAERGAPVSSRNPQGPVHAVSLCTFESGLEGVSFFEHLTALAPLFNRLNQGMPDDVDYCLSVMAEGRQLGSMLELDVESLGVLHRAKCRVVFDMYCLDHPDK